MTVSYTSFINHGRKLAEGKQLLWEMPLDVSGKTSTGWNLTQIVGARSQNFYLRDFGYEKRAVTFLNMKRQAMGFPLVQQDMVLSEGWQDFLKAAACEQLFFRRTTPGHVSENVLRPLKVLGTCGLGKEPWELTLDDVVLAVEIGAKIQNSGKLADLIKGVVRNIFDNEHIAVVGPLYPTLSGARLIPRITRARHTKPKEDFLENLEHRKNEQKLPDKRAFWELVRIVFTEKPATFVDELRFIAIKTALITGLRAGEVCMLPYDWKRVRESFSTSQDKSGKMGGTRSSLLLRHFPEKQQDVQSDSRVMIEGTQFIPDHFVDVLTEALDRAVYLTSPLRQTLKLQTGTGRTLPQYHENDLVPILDVYLLLTGTATWLEEKSGFDYGQHLKRYSDSFSATTIEELQQAQRSFLATEKSTLDMAVYAYFFRLRNKIKIGAANLRFYDSKGEIRPPTGRMLWGNVFLKVGEVEEYVREHTPTKMSDTKPMRLESGTLETWELLFLTPKRSLAEERNGGICNINDYVSIGGPDPSFLINQVCEDAAGSNIFARYGETAEDRQLSLKSHSLRHLQNTELFRLGVADTIITKRYNRRSIAQSYVYDHRSLAEELDHISLPQEIEFDLGENATTIAKMIQTGKATGPIVEGFRRIQRMEGEAAAYEYLKGEADGFHATPYGHCLNSFLVNPCSKNLECFAGCRHLIATNLSGNREQLLSLQKKFADALEMAEALPAGSIGRENQISHARSRMVAIEKLVTTPEGEPVFPDGLDFSAQNRSVLDD